MIFAANAYKNFLCILFYKNNKIHPFGFIFRIVKMPVGCNIKILVGIYLYLKKENILKFKEIQVYK